MDSKKILFGIGGLVIIAGLLSFKSGGGWVLPVTGAVTSPFGTRIDPITGVSEFHNGIDIGVPVGTTIVSPASGTVKSIYNNADGGNQLIILHDNGYSTGYAHLDSVSVNQGDHVTQGQQIAISGATGNVTGAHLHFVVLNPAGVAIDPAGIVYPSNA